MRRFNKVKKIGHVFFLFFVFGAGITCSDVFVEKTEAAHLNYEKGYVVGPV